MSAQKGLNILIKISDTGASDGTMDTLGGIRTSSFSINSTPIDITSGNNQDRWRELMAGGIRTAEVSGSGIFDDDAAKETLRDHVMGAEQKLAYMTMLIPDWGTISGHWHVGNLQIGGDHDAETTFSADFASAGSMVWTPVA